MDNETVEIPLLAIFGRNVTPGQYSFPIIFFYFLIELKIDQDASSPLCVDNAIKMPLANVTDQDLPVVSSAERTIKYRRLEPCRSDNIKVLLLENIHPVAVKLFKSAGFQVH